MTVNLNIQSFSYSASRIQVAFGGQSTSPALAVTQAPEDRATLSAGALAPTSTRDAAASDGSGSAAPVDDAPSAEAPSAPAAAPEPRPSRAQQRAQALFAALDADKDGTVTKAEFKSGAKALLGRGESSQRAADDDGDGRASRADRRLDRKLSRAFDFVDGDDDGTLSAEEMTAAFQKIGRGGHGRREHPEGPQAPGGGPLPTAPDAAPNARAQGGASITTIQVTYVSIAIQRYTAVQGQGSAEPASTQPIVLPGASPDARPQGATAAPVDRPDGPVSAPDARPDGPIAAPDDRPTTTDGGLGTPGLMTA